MKTIIALSVGAMVIVVGTILLFVLQPAPHVAEAPASVDEVVVEEPAPVEASLNDLIVLESPLPDAVVESPLTITGKARGTWFFEASFPVMLTNWDGLIIAQGIATAEGDWMTEDFVPFTATLTFTVDPDVYSTRGSLILKKDNPSGLPEYDAALEVPVNFIK